MVLQMQKAVAKFLTFFYMAIAFSVLTGLHLHPEFGQKIPRLVLKNSKEDKTKDHRTFPEGEKSLLEYFLQNSLKSETSFPTKAFVKWALAILLGHNLQTKAKPSLVFWKEPYLLKENQFFIPHQYFLPPPSFLV